jgi:hypothetical protein
MFWATLWAMFSQTHLITLFAAKKPVPIQQQEKQGRPSM